MSNSKPDSPTSNEYLPCPFCGDRDIRSRHVGHPTAGSWVIECGSCPCELSTFSTEPEAWERWNKRPTPETSDDLTDKQRVDFLEGWVKHSRDRGFKWDTFTFNTDAAVSVREQIDQQIAVGMTEILKHGAALKANACQCDPNPSIGGSPPCPVHDGESASVCTCTFTLGYNKADGKKSCISCGLPLGKGSAP